MNNHLVRINRFMFNSSLWLALIFLVDMSVSPSSICSVSGSGESSSESLLSYSSSSSSSSQFAFILGLELVAILSCPISVSASSAVYAPFAFIHYLFFLCVLVCESEIITRTEISCSSIRAWNKFILDLCQIINFVSFDAWSACCLICCCVWLISPHMFYSLLLSLLLSCEFLVFFIGYMFVIWVKWAVYAIVTLIINIIRQFLQMFTFASSNYITAFQIWSNICCCSSTVYCLYCSQRL